MSIGGEKNNKNVTNQSPIEGFWGVKLGESTSDVVSKVKKIYPKSDWYQGSTYRAGNVQIAGLDAYWCYLQFADGVLTEAKFRIEATDRDVPAFLVDSEIKRSQAQAQSTYTQLCNMFASKYGTPTVTGEIATWRSSNGNSINIETKTYFCENKCGDYDPDDTWNVSVCIHITYSKGSNITSRQSLVTDF